MGMPKQTELRRVRKKLKKMEGTLALNPNATALERFRWNLHQKFVEYKLDKNMTQKEMAQKLKVDESHISKILNYRLDEFSTDRLILLYAKLNPKVKLEVGS
ncbi:XRE family transcriptional regulator [Pseudobdellovibrio exovorus]|uniref:HTH cro/C1-type domain-containing protein n=1 Tax=Pseudobdellovibrio exovorus JSS TaxID=1184267 RepID=M4V4M2_9BACT|nr:XRE family transcriptional regulator [Pseudobdellovibrio exovorus]AGH94282.1 hypothetical protein A11Q_62 [Pseudobdellovibrio exovorus JSS]